MATIKEVAELAGVSVATVSRVINNNGYVNSETKKRVVEAIDQLNYRPNDVARSLFKGRSKMIALFVPDIMNPFFPELARAVEDITNQYDYTFVLCNTDDDLEKEIAYLEALQQKSVDGIIVVSSTLTEEHVKKITVPIIALDRIFDANLSSVTVNNREGAIEATNFLKSVGCTRIAHISGPKNASNTLDRMRGYLDVVKEEDWFTTDYIVSGDYHLVKAKKAITKLLVTHPEIDGLFVANDVMGVGAIKAAEALGKHVPDDLAIIAFDGISLGETTSPTLTTMAQPIYQIGTHAALLLMEQIDSKKVDRVKKEFPVELIRRQSTNRWR